MPYQYNDSTKQYDQAGTTYDSVWDASGSATGSSTATGVRVVPRTASGSSTASSSVTTLRKTFASGSGSAVGSSTSTDVRIAFRVASGSATGSSSVTWVKSLIFRPPVNDSFSWVSKDGQVDGEFLLRKLVPGGRAKNVYKLLDGSFTTNQPAEVEDYTIVYLGAHNNFVSAEEKADLIAAGYGPYVT